MDIESLLYISEKNSMYNHWLVPTMRCYSQHCRIGNNIYTVTYFKFCDICQHIKFVLSLTSVISLLNVKIKDIFRTLITSRFQYYSWYQIKLDNSKIEVFSLTLDISTNSTLNLTTNDSFVKCSSWGFRNCSCLPDLIKILWRYRGLKRILPFSNCLV